MEWECGGLKTSRAPIASHHPDASGLVAAEVTTFETFPVLGVGLGPRLSELPDLSLSAPPALRGSCAPPSPSQEPRSRRDPLPTLSRARAPLSSSCPVDGAEPSLLPRLPRWSRPAPPEPAGRLLAASSAADSLQGPRPNPHLCLHMVCLCASPPSHQGTSHPG